MYFFGRSATAVIEYFTHIMHLSNWIQKFENSFLGFLFTFTGIILWLILLLFYFSFFKYICLIIGSPVFAYLSRKTESIIEDNDHTPGWSEIKTEVCREASYIAMRNCGWQTFTLLVLFFYHLFLLVGWITPLIALVIECYYYGFSMLDYGFARNKYTVCGKHSIYRPSQRISNRQWFFILPDACCYHFCSGLCYHCSYINCS